MDTLEARMKALGVYSVENEISIRLLIEEIVALETGETAKELAPYMGHRFGCPVHPTNYKKMKESGQLQCDCGLYELRRKYDIIPPKKKVLE